MSKKIHTFLSVALRAIAASLFILLAAVPARSAQALPVTGPNIGTQPMVVILVSFQNIQISTPLATLRNLAFGTSSSISDYFAEASYNRLRITPAAETQGTANDGVISVTLSGSHPNTTSEAAALDIASRALAAANPYIHFDDFDVNGNGYVYVNELHILMIVAGYDDLYSRYMGVPSQQRPTPRIEGHFAAFEPVDPLRPVLDGVNVAVGTLSSAPYRFGGYLMFGEKHQNARPNQGYTLDTHTATIGPIAREIGFELLWPVLTIESGGSAGPDNIITAGAGEWSLMGTGYWNGITWPGDSPAHPDAFLKWYQGWITPTNTFDGRSYVLGSAATRANALLIGEDLNGVEWQLYSNPPVIGTSEYWLVENRQLTGYDAALPGCGILIWHVYEGSPTTNEANADSTLPLVALEQADGLGHLEQSILPPDVYPSVNLQLGDPQDTYGLETRLDWGPATTPNSNFYVGGFNTGNSSMRALSVNPIADCSSDSFMTVVYNGPEPAPPMQEGLFLPLVQK